MINVSFAKTVGAFADLTKTETRRYWKPSHAKKFKPGTIFMGINKDFRAGGVRIHEARVVACYQERLGDISAKSFAAEGGARYWANRADYIAMMGAPDDIVTVLRFEHVPVRVSVQCEICGEFFQEAELWHILKISDSGCRMTNLCPGCFGRAEDDGALCIVS